MAAMARSNWGRFLTALAIVLMVPFLGHSQQPGQSGKSAVAPSIRRFDIPGHLLKFDQKPRILQGSANEMWSVTFSPDGKTVVSASGGMGEKPGQIRFWDLATGKEKSHVEEPLSIRFLKFSPDGKTVATASWDSTIKLWDAATGKELSTLRGHNREAYCVAFSPDGKLLATSSADQSVKLWDSATKQNLATFTGHTDNVYSVAFSPDGIFLASGSWDKTAKLWDLTTRRELLTLKPAENENVNFALTFPRTAER